MRSALAAPLSIAANLGQLALFAGLFMLATSLGQTFLLIGIIGLGAVLLFHLVTLPVEFDASNRALAILEKNGYLSVQENQGSTQSPHRRRDDLRRRRPRQRRATPVLPRLSTRWRRVRKRISRGRGFQAAPF
ncbi:MAG: zinc metallopeptidase [Pleurocapsa sp. SU_196_0]|nr:zinc metallopeptidase [Pleurocapsa sp. SU_196_0]